MSWLWDCNPSATTVPYCWVMVHVPGAPTVETGRPSGAEWWSAEIQDAAPEMNGWFLVGDPTNNPNLVMFQMGKQLSWAVDYLQFEDISRNRQVSDSWSFVEVLNLFASQHFGNVSPLVTFSTVTLQPWHPWWGGWADPYSASGDVSRTGPSSQCRWDRQRLQSGPRTRGTGSPGGPPLGYTLGQRTGGNLDWQSNNFPHLYDL